MKKEMIMMLAGASLMSCGSHKEEASKPDLSEVVPVEAPVQVPQQIIGGVSMVPKAVVYRTRADYRNNVPVNLNNAGTDIVSYPAPSDVRRGNGYATPVELADGYLLDRRGIGKNVAFLDYTYEQYAALETAPSVKELMKHIIDRHPLTALYELPIEASAAEKSIDKCNDLVNAGFPGCKKADIMVAPQMLELPAEKE